MSAINIIFTAFAALLCVISLFSKKLGKSFAPINAKADTLIEKLGFSHYIALALILALAAFVRIYMLAQIPAGIHVDEAATAYSAYSLLNYGVDRYLCPYPVYLLSFDGGQSALYPYLTTLSYRIFGGYSMFAARFVAAACGVMCVAVVYWLCKLLFSKRCALFAAFLASVLPVFIMTSRFAFDCFLLLDFFTLSLAVFAKAVRSGKTLWYALSGLCFGVTLYSYAVSYIIVPLFCVFSFAVLIAEKKVSFMQVLAFALPLFLLALPLLLFVAINAGILDEIKTPYFTIPKMQRNRANEVSLAHLLDNLKNFPLLVTNDGFAFCAVKPYYTLCMASVPFVIYGFYLSVVKALRGIKDGAVLKCLPLFAFVSCALAALFSADITIYRANAIQIAFLLFIVLSVREIYRTLRGALPLIAAMYCVCFSMFSSYYFTKYNDDFPVIEFVQRNGVEAYSYARDKFPDAQIYFTAFQPDFYKSAYVYPLLADLPSPYDFYDSFVEKWGSVEYGNVHCFLPIQMFDDGSLFYEIYDDAVYVLNTNYANETFSSCDSALIEAGFTKEEMSPYNIYYKD